MDADVIVAGGGTSGCVVAARLAATGKSVVLIEAGPDYGPRGGEWPADLLAAATLPTSHDWGYAGPGASGHTLTHDRAKVIGGCSTHNGCSQMMGWAGDYDAWSRHSPGWSAQELRPLIEVAARQLQIRHYAPEEIQPFQREFLLACAAAGLTIADDFIDLDDGAGAGCPPVNIDAGTRINAAFGYLDDVRSLPNVTVLANATVDRVLLTDGSATGLAAVGVSCRQEGRSVTVRGQEVVLAAGAYGSPAILQRSGIGDREQLLAAGVTPLVDLPGVGRNLHDHPAAQLEFLGSPALSDQLAGFAESRWLPEEQAVAKFRSPTADGPYDIHVYPWVEPDANPSGWKCVFPVALVTPRSRGLVTITSTDPEQAPVIDPAYFSDAGRADLGAVRAGVRWTQLLITTPGLAELLGPQLAGPTDSVSDAELDEWILNDHAHYWHPAGSCRMGPVDDPRSVVDFAGRVHGVPGLRVADASVFPDIPRSTPALPTVIVGERIARFMLDGR